MSRRKQTQTVTIQVIKDFDGPKLNLPRLKKLIRAICSRFELRKADISIVIVNDAKIRKLNKQFRNRNSSTDCLSFDLSDNKPGCGKSFELFVNAERAVKEADVRGHSVQAELALYISHALLHNLGFDDSDPKAAEKMHDTEDEILRRFGFGTVYNT